MPTAQLQELLVLAGGRYFPPVSYGGDLRAAMEAFGLRPDVDGLQELTKAQSVAVLRALLWKGMAYGNEHCDYAEANAAATDLLDQYDERDARYFSNGNWAEVKSWNPLTQATFDSGILILSGQDLASCVWFEDED